MKAVYLQHCPQCLAKLPPPSPVERPLCGCCLYPTATVHLHTGVDLCDECCVVHFKKNKFGSANPVVEVFSRPPRQTQFDFTKYSGWVLGGWWGESK